MKTFLFQGDSITDANRDDENQDNFGLGCGYAFLLAADIEKNRKGEIKFLNCGKSGDRITDVYARIKEDIINLKPDYMSILIGVNDVSHELTQGCGVAPEKFHKIYNMLIEEIKESLPEIKIIILEPFVLKGSATNELWKQFNCKVRKLAVISEQVAKQYNLKFVPLQNKFDDASSDGDTRYWSVDGIHPTSAGHQIIKEELQKAIEEII
ncbi:MAG: lysophospholipase [Ruminococcaceae bacterium]|nr:lysophospholipase [Oscillospiraceae bacterium]